MESLMSILSIKNILVGGRNFSTGITICFKSSEVLTGDKVYITFKNQAKYFQISEVSHNLTSDFLLYKATECGYGQDKLSKITDLDIRDLIAQPVILVTSEEDVKQLNIRSSYT